MNTLPHPSSLLRDAPEENRNSVDFVKRGKSKLPQFKLNVPILDPDFDDFVSGYDQPDTAYEPI
jgi:hypothetical protein